MGFYFCAADVDFSLVMGSSMQKETKFAKNSEREREKQQSSETNKSNEKPCSCLR